MTETENPGGMTEVRGASGDNAGIVADAYARYDSDPRANGPWGYEAFCEAVTGAIRDGLGPIIERALMDIDQFAESVMETRTTDSDYQALLSITKNGG